MEDLEVGYAYHTQLHIAAYPEAPPRRYTAAAVDDDNDDDEDDDDVKDRIHTRTDLLVLFCRRVSLN